MIITIENLTLSYDRHPAVHHMNGTFEAGSLTAITGPNGAGKSTLLKAIAGILTPSDGQIHIACSTDEIAYLPQASAIDRDFPITALQMIATGFWKKAGGFGKINADHLKQAQQTLQTVGLQGFEHRQLSTLSAGQMQRALFARLIVQDAKVILLDEPLSAVDTDTCEKLLEIIAGWHKEGRTIICVLHDFAQIREHFPQCLLLARDCIGWGKTSDILTSEKLSRTRQFRAAWQDHPEVCEQ
ncbi:MAG: metal ABC transporter ATP-binding protein [Alphaproteobacteria bacterium]